MPKHVGTWVIVVEENSFTKFGKKGDVKFPFDPDDKEAKEEALYQLNKNSDANVYILHVFDNGQIKQYFFDRTLTNG